MAQQFQVLRCCSCHVFQVQQVKKSKKWNCKICNEKQSVLKIFGQGSGSDCRSHVQKLNLLQGEQEQASLNMPWHSEKPEKRDDKNTVAQLEETSDRQTRPFGEEKVSRWNKYLDRGCEEEKMLHTEKQNYSSLKNTAEEPRKRKKTSFGSSDAQKAEENRVSGFGKNHRRNSFRGTRACGNATHKSMEIPASEELLVHGKSEEAGLRKAVLSDQKKTLSTETVLECQGPVTQRSVAGCDEIIANFIDSPPTWQHIRRQTACVFIDKVQKDNEHIEEANILTEKNKNTPVLASANLQMLPKEPASIPSVHPLAFSRAPGQYSSLFSTGDDFDDYL